MLDRCRELIEHGVRVAILIDPIRHCVHVLRAGVEVGPLRADDVIDIDDVIPGLRLTAATVLAAGRSARRRS
jgi:hypothetical protein